MYLLFSGLVCGCFLFLMHVRFKKQLTTLSLKIQTLEQEKEQLAQELHVCKYRARLLFDKAKKLDNAEKFNSSLQKTNQELQARILLLEVDFSQLAELENLKKRDSVG